ncbi:hypothetical protein M758_UG095900 [Ceratodon purpureus]|nr:hypothetical protein M758_UG095900 [Ceratodon purpureus]
MCFRSPVAYWKRESEVLRGFKVNRKVAEQHFPLIQHQQRFHPSTFTSAFISQWPNGSTCTWTLLENALLQSRPLWTWRHWESCSLMYCMDFVRSGSVRDTAPASSNAEYVAWVPGGHTCWDADALGQESSYIALPSPALIRAQEACLLVIVITSRLSPSTSFSVSSCSVMDHNCKSIANSEQEIKPLTITVLRYVIPPYLVMAAPRSGYT